MTIDQATQVPVNVVGSSTFGRYPKISSEKTYNMFISDDWLVNYAGYQKVDQPFPSGVGRALFHSVRGNFLLVVESSAVYTYTPNLVRQFVGNIDTVNGEVFVDENLNSQICIVDSESAWIYNYANNTFTQQTLTYLGNPIIPNYVCYHNSFFLIASSELSINAQNWYAFQYASPTTISLNTQFSLQTKPDFAIAVKRLPGRGNNVLVLGSTVGEIWTQVGGSDNYRRIQSFNIDNGVISVSTIAANEEFVCWLAQSENNAPTIVYTDGGSVNRISSDGIDSLLQTLQFPHQSTAFFLRQDGHLFYQVTFYNPADDLTLFYDFNTKQFFHASDENLNFHPAQQAVYFNGEVYFVSLNDAGLYQMGTQFVTYNYNLDPTLPGKEIPRIRICKSIRKKDSQRFRVGLFTFWLEQGVNQFYTDSAVCMGLLITEDGQNFIITEDGNQIIAENGACGVQANQPRVDMSFSKNGNQSFSNVVGRPLNVNGQYRNQIRWHRMGQANEFTIQLRFWGLQRFVANDGLVELIA
jgi:hypothetical protein